MAKELGKQRREATIVVAGGAVNTLYLRSRSMTGDVNFFLAYPDHPDRQAIMAAADKAQASDPEHLDRTWINTAVTAFFKGDVQSRLFNAL